MQLKIIHFSTADNEGGSGRSAYRIHQGIRKLGHDSKMLVGKKVTRDPDVSLVSGGVFGRLLDIAADRLTRLFGLQYLHVPSSANLLKNPLVRNANLIQLFNTHGGYFSHTILPQLSKIAPIVWRLSDMWPMTPHSAYTYGCECYKSGPDNCKCKLSFYPPIYRNTKKKLWEIKEKIYSQSDITVVAPSSWIEETAKNSILLSRFKILKIPNGINLEVFHPRDRLESRRKFGINPDSQVILFSAHGLDNNPRKGSKALTEALNKIGPQKNIVLLLAGEGGKTFESAAPFPVKKLGYIIDQDLMASVYSCADLTLVPSAAENLPNNLLESMACAVPAVAFDSGGIRDAVKHMETGYLARASDTDEFAEGIRLLLNDAQLRNRLAANGRKLVEQEFDQKREAKAFESLYLELRSVP